jgi:hypothetical protein
VRFNITPLGGAGRSVTIVDAIVRFLTPRTLEPAAPCGPGPGGGATGTARHYADAGEEPGRWRGRGDGEALPAVPPPPIDGAVSQRLARSVGELTAWELHQATRERTLRRHIEAIGL